ncbi:MAG: hypothetical protein ACRC1O_05060 [Ralstonia mannitolilytica]|uniref:Uncharacterized protein n=1 Tax=Ralstonia pickettii (strain 12D) TaxID=428406 RepID=C6BC91_RALP1
MSRFDAMYPKCGHECNCGMMCQRAVAIDSHYAGKLAFMLECMTWDADGNFDNACALLEEYKAEWDKVNPPPPTFMGEPVIAGQVISAQPPATPEARNE